MTTAEPRYWFSKNRDRAFWVVPASAGFVVGPLVAIFDGLNEAGKAAELMVGPSAVLFSVGVIVLHWTTVRDGAKPPGERRGAERDKAGFRWWSVTIGALLATPVNVLTAVMVPLPWFYPIAGLLVGLMTMCNLLVLGLAYSSLGDIVQHGHGDRTGGRR